MRSANGFTGRTNANGGRDTRAGSGEGDEEGEERSTC